jgi:hypothetical protein
MLDWLLNYAVIPNSAALLADGGEGPAVSFLPRIQTHLSARATNPAPSKQNSATTTANSAATPASEAHWLTTLAGIFLPGGWLSHRILKIFFSSWSISFVE